MIKFTCFSDKILFNILQMWSFITAVLLVFLGALLSIISKHEFSPLPLFILEFYVSGATDRVFLFLGI